MPDSRSRLVLISLFLLASCNLPAGQSPSSTASPSPTPLPPSPSPQPTAAPTHTLVPTGTPTPSPGPAPSGDPTVPDLVGLPIDEALTILESLDFETYVNYLTLDAPLGTVARQTPEPGSIYQSGVVVRLYVSVEFIIISTSPGLEVSRKGDLYFPLELEAGVTYYFYTQDTFNRTDGWDAGDVFNLPGWMSISPTGVKNDRWGGFTYTPKVSGSYDLIFHNHDPVRYSFTLIYGFYSMGD